MHENSDRLYDVLPEVYRRRDVEHGEPLHALLQVIAEQVNVVEDDIRRLYDNWFIETCREWVVPYIGDLVGFEPVHEAGQPGEVATEQGRLRNKILTPRAEVGNTIRNRRRKGALALLELLARDVANWPARAVEFYELLAMTQNLNHLRLGRGRTVNLRNLEDLARIDGPFDVTAHTVDVRRVSSLRTRGKYNIPNVGLFVWRSRSYSITQAQAYRREQFLPQFYFSILANNTPLFNKSISEDDPTTIASEINLPVPIRRGVMARNPEQFYGADKSLYLWTGLTPEKPVPLEMIMVSDLEDWDRNQPPPGKVAIDPESGRIVFHPDDAPGEEEYVWVSYHYGFPADIGGGEYLRTISQLSAFELGAASFTIGDVKNIDALIEKLRDAANPISQHVQKCFSKEMQQALAADGSEIPNEMLACEMSLALEGACLYDEELFEQLNITLPPEAQALLQQEISGFELRHLNRLLLTLLFPNVIRTAFIHYSVGLKQEFDTVKAALDAWHEDPPMHAVIEITDNREYVENLKIQFQEVENQSLQIRAANGRRPVIRVADFSGGKLDAVRVIGKNRSRFFLDGLLIAGRGVRIEQGFCEVVIRHCTLVPGWTLQENCEPEHPDKHSLFLKNLAAAVRIEDSIIGSIQIQQNEVDADPLDLCISDSIVDAMAKDAEAIAAPKSAYAHAALTILRSTIKGTVHAHAIALAENSIFYDCVQIARRQIGCIRFSYVTPDSRTPKRFNCQPDLAKRNISNPEKIKQEEKQEEQRVKPRFNSERYGATTYFQLAFSTPPEIRRGADDESEMGVYHDLFQPQRETNLRIRLDEYTPAGMDSGVFFVS